MPIVVSGVALGIASVSEVGGKHLADTHQVCLPLRIIFIALIHYVNQKWGIALFVLYFVQNAFGAVVHWVKTKSVAKRPPQNYLHAVLGLFIIGAAYYQVRTGYRVRVFLCRNDSV